MRQAPSLPCCSSVQAFRQTPVKSAFRMREIGQTNRRNDAWENRIAVFRRPCPPCSRAQAILSSTGNASSAQRGRGTGWLLAPRRGSALQAPSSAHLASARSGQDHRYTRQFGRSKKPADFVKERSGSAVCRNRDENRLLQSQCADARSDSRAFHPGPAVGGQGRG